MGTCTWSTLFWLSIKEIVCVIKNGFLGKIILSELIVVIGLLGGCGFRDCGIICSLSACNCLISGWFGWYCTIICSFQCAVTLWVTSSLRIIPIRLSCLHFSNLFTSLSFLFLKCSFLLFCSPLLSVRCSLIYSQGCYICLFPGSNCSVVSFHILSLSFFLSF